MWLFHSPTALCCGKHWNWPSGHSSFLQCKVHHHCIERERAPLWFVWSSVTVVGSCPSIVSTVPPPPPHLFSTKSTSTSKSCSTSTSPPPSPPLCQSSTQPETGHLHLHLVRVQKLQSQQQIPLPLPHSEVWSVDFTPSFLCPQLTGKKRASKSISLLCHSASYMQRITLKHIRSIY